MSTNTTTDESRTTAPKPRRWLLTQNRQLRAEGIFNWTLPAWGGRFQDGTTYNACPEAQACAKLCYARVGTYRWPVVLAAHERNMWMVKHALADWEAQMAEELRHKRYRGKWIRLHDSGDFFSDEYLEAWLRIMRNAPEDTWFYCYTKSVSRFRRLVEPNPPKNFLWCYSLGGKEDKLLDLETDRHADVFPSVKELEEAGYTDQTESDLLSVLSDSHMVGIPANRIPMLLKRQGSETFSSLQRALDKKLTEKRQRAAEAALDLAS
ncbi:GP88 family protein [Streptomyces scabiei]|uniref:GP88 family protein n=1 Tax=Streptomyces scabiei TaxID=1930 RepID=UPI0038F756B4